MRRIIVKHGEGKRIAKLFNTSEQVVVRAFRFGSKSELSNKIREYALQNGGVEVHGFIEN